MGQIDIIKSFLNLLKKIGIIILTILLSISFLISLQYYNTEIFNKELNTPFSGNYLYNPYKDFSGATLKANFHAHSVAWLKLTNGAQEPSEIYKHYKDNGYDLISLSNYHKITRDHSASIYIPVYEHGYNIKKSHQLVLNAEKVNFFDFSAFQNYHNKQLMLKKLMRDSSMIVLAHPNLMEGYTQEEMRYLRGYQFIEVFNNYRTSLNIWDAALSSGYPAWLIANDDTHDISNPDLSLNNWNRIGDASKTKNGVLAALKKGCHYSVRNKSHKEVNYLDSCIVDGNNIKVYFKQKTDSVQFISDNGEIRQKSDNLSSDSYTISLSDSYVRIEAYTGEEIIALNPIIRYNGISLSKNNLLPTVNLTKTILYRTLVFSLSLLHLFIIMILHRKNILIKRVLRKINPSKIRI